jgi:hypothetical protein
MKTHPLLRYGTIAFALLASVALLFIGCKSTAKVDWESRVGSYTFDQAVNDLGPPDKQTKTSDGSTVAEWVTGRSGGSGLSIGTGVFGSSGGVGVSQSVGSGGRNRFLRLTFDPDGLLSAWKKGP